VIKLSDFEFEVKYICGVLFLSPIAIIPILFAIYKTDEISDLQAYWGHISFASVVFFGGIVIGHKVTLPVAIRLGIAGIILVLTEIIIVIIVLLVIIYKVRQM